MIALRGLAKAFGGSPAVRGVDLDVAAGDLVALLGPSGCGKTTVLRMVAGLDTPDAGTIALDGVDVTATPPQRRGVGLVAQRYALFPHMTVARNVAFGPETRGWSRADTAGRVDEMLRLVRLHPQRDRFPAQLSGGQAQRVALARTLAPRPAVLLLDEPFAALDAGLRAEMRGFLRRVQRETGVTTLMVTHDQAEAMEMADRVAVMLDGRLAQVAAPDALHRRPASHAVAAFMGAANVLRARVAHGMLHLHAAILPAPPDAAPGDGYAVLRPETLRFTAPGDGSIAGRITGRTFHGATVTWGVDTPAGPLTVLEASAQDRTIGDAVGIRVDARDVWIMRS